MEIKNENKVALMDMLDGEAVVLFLDIRNGNAEFWSATTNEWRDVEIIDDGESCLIFFDTAYRTKPSKRSENEQ